MAQPLRQLALEPSDIAGLVDPLAPTVRMRALRVPDAIPATVAPARARRLDTPEIRTAGAPTAEPTDAPAPAAPYDLALGEGGSAGYYRTVAALGDEVVAAGMARFEGAIVAFLGHGHRGRPTTPRSGREALVELLTLGVLYRAYGARVGRLPGWARVTLLGLGWLRTRVRWMRGPADALRGRLLGRYCSDAAAGRRGSLTASASASASASTPTAQAQATVAGLRALVAWLMATGDYRSEARRLGDWARWLATRPAPEAEADLTRILAFAAWFEAQSAARLAPFTAGAARYASAAREPHRRDEDLLLVTRGRPEVHLNLVGAEILNRALRAGFVSTARRIVLLPGCMRRRPEGECRATGDGLGLRCAGCDARCAVARVARVAEQEGAEVRVLTHATQLVTGRALRDAAREGREVGAPLGVVGVACAGHLLSGGWLTRDLGVDAQCVVLDRPGCARHWHPEGVATELDLAELRRRLAA